MTIFIVKDIDGIDDLKVRLLLELKELERENQCNDECGENDDCDDYHEEGRPRHECYPEDYDLHDPMYGRD